MYCLPAFIPGQDRAPLDLSATRQHPRENKSLKDTFFPHFAVENVEKAIPIRTAGASGTSVHEVS
jgi:hypothetical protein